MGDGGEWGKGGADKGDGRGEMCPNGPRGSQTGTRGGRQINGYIGAKLWDTGAQINGYIFGIHYRIHGS